MSGHLLLYQSPHSRNGDNPAYPGVRYICDQIGWGEFDDDYCNEWPGFT